MNTVIVSSFDMVAPLIVEAATAAFDSARAAGFNVIPFETYRTPERQDFLYEKGRTMPGRVVTNKPAWKSWHQYGCALDVAFWTNGAWSWNGNFGAVSKYFLVQGFEWLHPFEDVHFQMRNKWQVEDAYVFIRNHTLTELWEAMGLA